MKRLLNRKKVAEIEELERQYNKKIIQEQKEYYQLPDNESDDKLSFVLAPSATLEQWNQDPIDYHSPHPGHDGFFAESNRWIGR